MYMQKQKNNNKYAVMISRYMHSFGSMQQLTERLFRNNYDDIKITPSYNSILGQNYPL